MLLEHVSCLFFYVNFQNLILIYLWVLLCFKVGDVVMNFDEGINISTILLREHVGFCV